MKTLAIRLFICWVILIGITVAAGFFNPPTFSGVPVLMLSQFPPNSPNAGCPPGYNPALAGLFCDFNAINTHHLDGVYARLLATTVDTGTTSPNFSNWAAADAQVKWYALYSGNGNTVNGINNSGGVSTMTLNANSPFPAVVGAPICITGNAVAGYNTCFPAITAVTYVGNFATQVKWNQAANPGPGSGGNVAFGCGDALPGRNTQAAPCKIVWLIQNHQNNLAVLSSPPEMFTQQYANAVAPAWQALTFYGMRSSVKSGSFYCHNVTAGGGATSGNSGAPNCNGSGTVVDGGITWQQDGSNALPQETIIGQSYVGTTNDPPAANWSPATTGGIIININSNQCNNPSYNTACAQLEVGVGMPVWTETPWRTWLNTWYTTTNDGNGNLGVIPHMATVGYNSQIAYIAPGWMDLSEAFGFLSGQVMSSQLFNLTFAQYLSAFVDDYIGTQAINNVAAWNAQGPPNWLMDTRTNTCSTCATNSQSLLYASEIVAKVKVASSKYGFGNQGVSIGQIAVDTAGTYATSNTGFWPPYFNTYLAEASTVPHHLQPLNSGDCPSVAGLASIGTTQGTECTAGQITVGPMSQWMPFNVRHGMSTYEAFSTEVFCTWDVNYTVAGASLTLGNQPTYTDCNNSIDNYQAVWNHAAQGLPVAPTNVSGSVAYSGAAKIN